MLAGFPGGDNPSEKRDGAVSLSVGKNFFANFDVKDKYIFKDVVYRIKSKLAEEGRLSNKVLVQEILREARAIPENLFSKILEEPAVAVESMPEKGKFSLRALFSSLKINSDVAASEKQESQQIKFEEEEEKEENFEPDTTTAFGHIKYMNFTTNKETSWIHKTTAGPDGEAAEIYFYKNGVVREECVWGLDDEFTGVVAEANAIIRRAHQESGIELHERNEYKVEDTGGEKASYSKTLYYSRFGDLEEVQWRKGGHNKFILSRKYLPENVLKSFGEVIEVHYPRTDYYSKNFIVEYYQDGTPRREGIALDGGDLSCSQWKTYSEEGVIQALVHRKISFDYDYDLGLLLEGEPYENDENGIARIVYEKGLPKAAYSFNNEAEKLDLIKGNGFKRKFAFAKPKALSAG